MNIARTARLFPCLVLLALPLAISGCGGFKDWLEPAGSESRSSPVISGLTVVPASVFCGADHPFLYSFDYEDPQNDIFQVHLLFEHTDPEGRIERLVLWTEMDLATVPGRAIGEFFFDCAGLPTGTWTFTVTAEDDLGHLSNELKTDVTLL